MYAILSGGMLIALCDKPRYVRKNAEGVYVEAHELEADGIAVNGELYNIIGSSVIPGAPEAIIITGNVSEYVFRNHEKIVKNETETYTAFVDMENAICDLDTTTDERFNEVENALCELDGVLNGGGEN